MHIFRRFCSIALITALSVLAPASVALDVAYGHEYWIEPVNFTPDQGEIVAAHLKVGSDFKGDRLPFIPQFVRGYQAFDAMGTRDMEGAAGDRPALNIETRIPGLLVVTYQTTQSRVTFEEFEKFESYLITQGMPEIAERHRARQLPQTDFTELYSRYAKTLINVGGQGQGAGNDQATGMVVELVALDNPYALSTGDTMRIELLWQGQALPDRQVKLFAQSQQTNDLEVVNLRTDETGQIAIVLQPATRYLLSAIQMREIDPVQGKESWESFWASLTFEMPE